MIIKQGRKKLTDAKFLGKFNYWSGLVHTTRRGSEIIANLITEDLLKFIKKN